MCHNCRDPEDRVTDDYPWISVDDKLPKDQDDVIAAYEYEVVWLGGSRTEIMFVVTRFYEDDGFEEVNELDGKAVYWMHIPELKGEDK